MSNHIVVRFKLPVFLILLFSALIATAVLAQDPPVPSRAPGLDGDFVALAAQIPGFGGYFFDSNGDLNVYLKDLSQEDRARTILQAAAQRRSQGPRQNWTRPANIVTRPAEFDFLQLDAWRGQLSHAATRGMLSLDTNEALNRIVIGVNEEKLKKGVLKLAADLGIPRRALRIQVEEPVELVTDLGDYVRPVVGGLEINFQLGGRTNRCTLGLNVYYTNLQQGIPSGTKGFLTAAHCGIQGEIDHTVFSQGGSAIGVETWDPPYFTAADDFRCPQSATGCRWSDVAFARYDSGVSRQQGAIAQTLWWSVTPKQSGSTTINPAQPVFTTFQITRAIQGDYLDKVGRTTGWTTGEVLNTCVDQWSGDIRLLCQNVVAAYAAGGDSGSPVFKWTSSTTAAFAGIVWGARPSLSRMYFSGLEQLEADLGGSIGYAP